MKRQEWNEEKLEQLLKQLPHVHDKQSAEDIYQSILYKQQNRKKSKSWIAPTFATVAALFIFLMFTPYLFQEITSSSNEEKSMDKVSDTSSGTDEAELRIQDNTANKESSLMQEEFADSEAKALEVNEQVTFVTPSNDGEETITIGVTDASGEYIIPISVNAEYLNKPQQIQDILVENLFEKIGPVGFELQNTQILPQKNPEELILNYTGEPILSSSKSETMYKEAIQETFRWLGYNKVNLQTNDSEGIEFGNSGLQTDLAIQRNRNKAYYLYQYNDNTSKLLVPSPESFSSINEAIEAMKTGLPDKKLLPPIVNQMINMVSSEDGTQIDIEFINGGSFEDNEQNIIMLEAILLTAKEFGYEKVKFNGIAIDKIGNLDLKKPIEVPFSPNPININ
ncbi:hypothetical protein [Metabacillus litoralis]|uniref:hypothetical protein n=1 Tax=Metabacillus litoralis TaxID=152268 RepID=UPI001CFD48E2|nr:hypothetical protein [Metabacillus litoralis]